MNKIYKSIWNEQTGTYVAVSENTKAKGKRSSSALLASAILAAVLGTTAHAQETITVGVGDPVVGTKIVFKDETEATTTTLSNTGLTTSTGAFSGAVSAESLNVTNVANVGLLTVTGTTNLKGANLGGEKITNLANGTIGVNSTDAVTGGQLHSVQEQVNKGLQVRANEGTADPLTLGETLTLADGNNTTVEYNADNNTFKTDLKQDISLTSVTASSLVKAGSLEVANQAIVDGTLGVSGLTTLSGGAKLNDQKITDLGVGVIAEDSKDAVTGGQIHNLFFGEEAEGIKYFRANSTAGTPVDDDAQAIGDDSVAIGPDAKAEGNYSFAAGGGGKDENGDSVAGATTTEEGVGAIALGQGAVAGGSEVGAGGAGAISIGRMSMASGTSSVALGDDAKAQAANAAALGASALASGANSIAIGDSVAAGGNSFAAGTGATAATNDSIALGTSAGDGTDEEVNDPGQRHSFIAIGKNAGQNMDGNEMIAIGVGAGSNSSQSQQVSIGTSAGTFLNGERNVSLGFEANKNGGSINHATAIGGMSVAKTDAVAVGYAAKAETTAVALGVGAQAKEGNIALGNNSFASNVSGAGSITGQAFSGTSVSVGNAETGLTRRITNVQDGHSGYDAVNVRQLEALKASLGSFEPESGGNVNYNPEGNTISVGDATAGNHAVSLQQAEALIADGKPRFYSVNPNGDSANANGEGALGPNSDNSMAIGHAARIDSAEKATAVGYKVLVKSNDGTALGSGSIVDDAAGVAVGLGAYSRGINSLAIGTDAQTEEKANGANADNAIAIGTKARASENSASALGHHATASGLKSSAMGFHANATGPDAIAFGSNSVASGSSSQASGTGARASGANAQASGTGARASGASAQASGTSAFGYASDGIALGTGAVSGFFDLHNQNPERNTAGIAIGSRSLADQQHALAMGVEAEARAKSSSAIGDGAKAQHEGSVALGSSAKTAAAVGFETYTIDKQTYTFAGTEPIATVSVGNDEEKRTITNVAAGHISAQSTDAINGSQLFQTNKAVDALGNNLDTAGESVAKALGGTSSYSPETHTVTAGLTVQGNKYTTVQDALNYVGQGWKVSAQGNNPTNVLPGETVDFKTGNSNLSVTKPADADEITYTLSNALDLTSSGSVTIGDTVLNNNGLTINGGPSVTTAGIDAGDLKITNVAPGDINPISKDAVNGSQLNSLADEIVNSYGGNASQTGGDITFTDIGGTGEDTIHDAIKQVNATANAGWNVSSNNGTTSANIGPDGTVDFTGDSNITIEQTGTDDDAKLAVKLNRDLDLDSVTAGGTVINANGLSFINLISGEPLPNTVAIKPYGIDMGNNKISNLAAGTNSTDAVNVGQLKGVVEVFGGEATIGLDGTLIAPTYVVGNADQEFNTVGDAIKELNTGWTVKSDGTIGGNTDGSAIQARDIVDIGVKNPADENLLVESKQDGDTTTIDFSLNQNLKLTSVNAGGTLINSDGLSFVDASGVQLPNTVFIKPDGIDMGGNKITNVAPGTIGEDSTDAINGSQLWALGDSLAKVFGGNAAFDPETGGLTITPYEINGEEFEDVYSAINKLAEGWKIDVGSGTPGESGGEGSAPGAGTGTGGPESILPGDQLTLVAGDNIIIEQKSKENKNVDIEISVNPNLVVDSVTAGQTVMDDSGVKVGDNVHLGDTGLTIIGGPTGDLAFTTDKVDVGGNKIENVADGIIADGSKDAINGGQIKDISQSVADAFGGGSTVKDDGTVSAPTYTVGNQDKVVNNVGDALDILNQGWTLSAEGNDTQVQAGDKVSLVNDDKNIVITHAADSGTVAFNLSDNIQVGETITIGGDKNNQTVINQGGITTNTVTATSVTTNNFNAGGGTMIVNEGSVAIAENTHINMGGNRITNVAPGVDGTDVVNMNQLGTVANSLSRDIRRVDREARAGTASAAAMANLPQAYLPGKSMFAVAGAGHRGESGYAAGLSTVSDNGKWVIKGSVAGNSRGDVTYGAGVGYQW